MPEQPVRPFRCGMLLSVGTGTRPDSDIVLPLVKSVRNTPHEVLAFLVSSVSKENAEKIAADLALPDYKLFEVATPDDVQTCFREALTALRWLRSEGCSPETITVDYTSGTKAMTAGVVLAAVTFRCGSLKYIAGTRQNGIVLPGTERFLTMAPAEILAYEEMQTCQHLMCHLRFDAALTVLAGISDALLDENAKGLRQSLIHIARAYQAWDMFDHRRFRGEYGKADWSLPEVSSFQLAAAIPARALEIAQAINESEITEDLVADLFNNAERRLLEGKYDDAVARLYRLTEMLAQRQLRGHGIDTSNVDLAKVPDRCKPILQHAGDSPGAKIEIGMKRAYWLLEAKGDPLGEAFQGNKELSGRLSERNHSILAHGVKPISEDACTGLRKRVLELTRTVAPDMEERCRQLQFPWLVSKP